MIVKKTNVPDGPMQPGLGNDQLATLLTEKFALVRDASDRWDLTMVAPAE